MVLKFSILLVYDYSKLGFIVKLWIKKTATSQLHQKAKKKQVLGAFFPLAHLFLEGRKSFPKVLPWELYQQFPQGPLTEFTLSARTMERQEKCARKLFQAEKLTWQQRVRSLSQDDGARGKVLRISHGKLGSEDGPVGREVSLGCSCALWASESK